MYICILDGLNYKNGRFSISTGAYPAYLVPHDCSRFYLVYMLGIGPKTERDLKKMTDSISKDVSFEGFETDTTTMGLGKDAHNYKKAVLAFKEYTIDNLPDDRKLVEDLANLARIHKIVNGGPYAKAIGIYRGDIQ